MFQLWHELEELAKTLGVEIGDQWKIANRWLDKLIAILILLPTLALWMEFCFSENINYQAVPFVAISLIAVSWLIIFTTIRPLGVAIALNAQRLPIIRRTWFAETWKRVLRWTVAIYAIEFAFLMVVWLGFQIFPMQKLHWSMIVFFTIILLWLFAVIIGKGPRSLLITIPVIVALVGLLVMASLENRPTAGSRAVTALDTTMHDASKSIQQALHSPPQPKPCAPWLCVSARGTTYDYLTKDGPGWEPITFIAPQDGSWDRIIFPNTPEWAHFKTEKHGTIIIGCNGENKERIVRPAEYAYLNANNDEHGNSDLDGCYAPREPVDDIFVRGNGTEEATITFTPMGEKTR